MGWWACQDLNLGPHPYQLTAGNRCADGPFRRSRPTGAAKVMRSIGALVCAHRYVAWHRLASVPHADVIPLAGAGRCAQTARRPAVLMVADGGGTSPKGVCWPEGAQVRGTYAHRA